MDDCTLTQETVGKRRYQAAGRLLKVTGRISDRPLENGYECLICNNKNWAN